MKKIISLSVDKKVYSNYLKHCRDIGMVMSKQVELFMKKELDKKQEKQ